MLNSHERDGAKARNEGVVGDKDVSAVDRLERDAEAGFCHDGVKVASNWTPYLTDARVRASFAPKEELPNSVLQSQPANNLKLKIIARKQMSSATPAGFIRKHILPLLRLCVLSALVSSQSFSGVNCFAT